MDELELISFNIIASVGSARSYYIEAIDAAKAGDFNKSEFLLKEGEKEFINGHHYHAELLQKEACKENIKINLILMHAEDQLMCTETFKIVAEEFISIHRLLKYN